MLSSIRREDISFFPFFFFNENGFYFVLVSEIPLLMYDSNNRLVM